MEVGGDCAVYANPATAEKVEKKLLEALELCKNANTIQAGVCHARSFTWGSSIKAHGEVFMSNSNARG
jgi:hypothetical protein